MGGEGAWSVGGGFGLEKINLLREIFVSSSYIALYLILII